MDEYRVRVRLFNFIILAVLVVLGLRLAQLQLIDTESYIGESRSNSIREIRVHPARGAFFDRNGRLIGDNTQTYAVTITPRYFDESKIGLLADLLEVPDSVVQKKLEEARAWNALRPTKSFREVRLDIFSRLLENLYELPGVGYEIEQKRRYPSGVRASHALGYIREITASELERLKDDGYRQGDLIGQTGLERRYEPYLRGRLGAELKLVNIRGRAFSSFRGGLEDKPPLSGYNLRLAMDRDVQALAESLFVNKRGGAVALDVKNGGIIALVSAPDYNPDVFAQAIKPAVWDYLTKSKSRPMLNRATMGRMPPGSTWKPFMALMALQEGYITENSRVNCPGYHPIGGGRAFRCMGVHGSLDVKTAIQRSCNTFFFEMMNRADVNTFSKYGHMFGFGEPAPTDIGEQDPGLIPDSAYFRRKTGTDEWGPGWTLSLGIGQGDMAVTPLQLARYMMAIANKGMLYAPHLVEELIHPETGERIRPWLPAPKRIPIEERHFDLVREGMKLVMEAGTGRLLQIPGIPSGGKTGTAQASNKGKDDSVFIMFAPFDDPQIAVAVMVENAGFGASAAGPIASLMVEQYLTGKIADTPARKALMQRALNASSALPPGWTLADVQPFEDDEE